MPRIPFLLVLVACSRTPSEPGGTAEPTRVGAPPADASAATPSTSVTRSGPASLPLHWDDPSRWQRRKPSSAMRAAEYVVPRAAGDPEDGECTVFTFGPGQGGSADDNI